MAKRLNHAKLLFEAAAAAKSVKKCNLPEEIMKKFEVQFEGIKLPRNTSTREKFLDRVTKISENIFCFYRSNMTTLQSFLINHASLDPEFKRVGPLIEGTVWKFALTAEAIEVTQRSSKTSRYMQFMARDGFDIPSFLSSMGLFAKKRKIIFEDVPKENVEIGKKILELLGKSTDDSLRWLANLIMEATKKDTAGIELDVDDYVDVVYSALWVLSSDRSRALRILHEQYPELCREYESISERDESLWDPSLERAVERAGRLFERRCGVLIYEEDDSFELMPFHKHFTLGTLEGFVISEPELLYKGSRAGFALICKRGGTIFVDSERGDTVQHELQHLFDKLTLSRRDSFDNEYRAYLAGLAFSENPQNAYADLYNGFETFKFLKHILGKDDDIDGTEHSKAKIRIIRQMMRATDHSCFGTPSSDEIKDTAMKLLNKVYKKECGLTYDEILEPFKK